MGVGRAVRDRRQHPLGCDRIAIVAELVAGNGGIQNAQVLWWALAIGADFGGNATAIGASADAVVLGIAERAGKPISFWQFTRYGLIVTVIAIAVPYLWLRYL